MNEIPEKLTEFVCESLNRTCTQRKRNNRLRIGAKLHRL